MVPNINTPILTKIQSDTVGANEESSLVGLNS